jgi:HNH endonuclease
MYESQQGLCAYCDCELNGDYHVEHMTPLSRGGMHDWSNIALACPTCNLRKNAKTVEGVTQFLYRYEMMGEEARSEPRDRIRRLKRKLETAAETVDAIHSGLERTGS